MAKEKAKPRKRARTTMPRDGRVKADERRLDKERRETERGLGNIVEGASEAILALDRQHRIIIFNKAAEKLFGYRREEILDKPLDLLLPERSIEIHPQLIHDFAVSPESARPIEKRITVTARRKGGTEFPVEIGLSKLGEGEQQFYTALIIDVTERKRTEQALRESEEQYRYLFNNNPQPMWTYDPESLKFLAVNNAAVAKYGYSREEFMRMSIADIRPSEDVERLVKEVKRPRPDLYHSGEWRHRLKGGALIDVEISTHALTLSGNASILVLAHDITDRKRSGEKLQASETRYRRLFESAKDGILILNAETGSIIDVNPYLENILGYAHSDVVGKTLWEISVFKDIAANQSAFEELLQKEYFRYDNLLLESRTGERRQVEFVSNVYDVAGEKIMQCNVRDITERKKAEEELAHDANLLAQVNDAVITLDQDFVVSSWNHGARKIYGWTADEVIGQTAEKAFRAEFSNKTLAEIRKQIQEEGEYIGEVIQYRKDGSRIFADGHTTALRDKSGAITGYLTINREITERKRAEEEIQKRSEQLEALRQISLDLTAELNLESLLRSIVQRAIPLIGAQTCSCYLLREDEHALEQVTLAGGPQLPQNKRTRERGEGLIGKVWERNEPIVVDDYQKWDQGRTVYAELPSRAVMGMPIRWGKKFLGVLVLTADLPRHFAQNEVELLSLFADQAAIAIQNARLFEETHRRADEFEALFGVGRELSQQHELSDILNRFSESAMKLVHAPAVTLSLYDSSKSELETVVAKNFPAELVRRVRLGEGVSGRVAATRNCMIVDNYSANEFRMPDMGTILRAQLQVPMLSQGELLGVLSLHELGDSTRKFTEADATLLMLLAGQAAGVVQSARLLDETRRRAEQLSTLNEISNVVSARLEIESVLEVIYQQVSRILPQDVFYIALYDDQTHLLTFPLLYDGGRQFEQAPSSPRKTSKLNQVIETGRAVLINRTAEEMAAPVDPQFLLADNTKRSASLLFVPLKHGARIIGIMSTQSYTLNAYTEEHLALFSGIANQVAVAIENARLFGDAEQNLQRVQALRQIDRAIAGDLDVQVTIHTFLTHVVAQLGVDAADVLVLKPQAQTLEFSAGIGFRTPALQHTHLRLGDGLAGKAALERKNVVVADLAREMNGLAQSPLIQGEGFIAYRGIPLIAKGRVNGVLEIFNRSPLSPNEEWINFLETLAGQAAIAIDNAELFENLQRSNIDLALAYDTTLEGWSRALDLRDHETEGHTQRVTEITLRLARTLGIGEAELVHIRRGGLLHDIGKMGIPDSVLLKPGELTDLEWIVMRQHPDIAFQLLSPITFLKPALDIPYCHHEKWDGTGYPRGLRGEQIPLAARIFAVVDVWDALLSNRVYRAAWAQDRAREHILALSGKHFEPRMVDAFFNLKLAS